MAEVVIGKVGLTPKGAYDNTRVYTFLDCVLFSHDSWVCVALNPDGSAGTVVGEQPSINSTKWTALTDGGSAAMAEIAQLHTEFDTWFGANSNSGIRKTVSD